MPKMFRINDSTYRFEDEGVRFFLFCGTEKAALIDSGMNVPEARKLAEELTDLPLILINTHADPDHISGNGAFDEIYMGANEEGYYRERGGKGKILPLREGDLIDLGDRPLRIIDIPGHTPGSIAILDEKNRVLVSGDSVEDGNIFMFGPGRDLDAYINSMQHLLSYTDRFDDVYGMHGSFPVTSDLVAKLIEGAKLIKDGKADGMQVDIFGKEAVLYKFPYAGFLL